jgi:predicted neutral ceramidase superfamily lipid hydrolase
MAILAVTTLFFLNIFLVGSIVDLVYPFVKKIEMIKTTAIGLGIICFIINYLLLYRNKYYEEIFDYFDKYESKYKKWDLSVLLYIVLSILFALGNLVFEDGKNNGYW